MFRRESSSALPVPPGFKSLSKDNRNSQVLFNTPSDLCGSFSPRSCREVDSSDNGKRITRKKNKSQMFDSAPPVPPTYKRRKGRPPGSGRKQTLSSLHAQGELGMGKQPQPSVESLAKQTNICVSPPLRSEGSHRLTPLQFGNKVIHVKTSPVILQSKQPSQNRKREPQDVTDDQPSTTCAREIRETTNEAQTMVSAPQYGHEKDANNQPNVTTSQLGSSTVSQSLAPILRAIINKHGDIVKDCPLKSGYMRTSLLEGICKVVQELQGMVLTELDSSHLCAYYAAVKDAEIMKLDVKWLRDRLDEIQKAVEAKKLTEIKTRRMEQMEVMKREVQYLKYEIEAKECQLAVETLEVQKLNSTISGVTSLSQLFQGKSLLDGLL